MSKNNFKKTKEESSNPNFLMNIFKIIILIAFMVVVTCTVLFFIEFNQENKSYFTSHFALPCILFMVGLISTLMAILSKKNLSGENKGDSVMIIVGILLMLCSIISLVWSYF